MARQIIFLTVARGPVPRDLSTPAEKVHNPETTAVCCHDRGMARDRPSPYVPCGDCLFLTVARGPVPRDLSTAAKNARNRETTDVCCHDRRTARDRPSPYVRGGDCLFLPVARGPVPRDRPRAPVTVVRDPDPERVKIGRSGPTETRQITCPSLSTDLGRKRPQPRDHGCLLSRPTHGEGQALALR